jgi:hypothetical protein
MNLTDLEKALPDFLRNSFRNFKSQTAKNNHGVRFRDAFDSAYLFDALVYFNNVHAAYDGYYVIFSSDLVDGLYIRNFPKPP